MKNLTYLSVMFVLLLASSCRSIEKMVDKGQYDEAIQLASKRMAGKKKKKTKHVKAVEEAFNKMTRRDMDRIATLMDEKRPENWDRIISIYNDIDRRQDKISPFLPLVSKDGYQAHFSFVKVDLRRKDAINKASEYHYVRAESYMKVARRGSKKDARNAYDQLKKLNVYFKHYKDSESLRREAIDLGQTRILVDVENNSRAIIPNGFEREIMELDLAGMNSLWKTYYTKAPANKAIDFKAVLNIHTLDLSPEREVVTNYIDEKEVKDGWEYVLDSSGNVLKDTLGNDVKQDRYVQIRAEVVEIYREKLAHIRGSLELRDARSKDLIRSEAIDVTALFEDWACTYRGDRRAIEDKRRKRLKNNPLPFPTDIDMVWQSAEELKLVFKENLHSLYL